jgi:phosphate:Na+ symporter
MLFAALAVFMFGLKLMSERLEAQSSAKLRNMFKKTASNKLSGMGVGLGVTAIIQSSSATTVMVVGLVNAGMLTLTQAATIIMGANMGTTVTAVIISLPITETIAAFGLIGLFFTFSGKPKIRNIGYVILSLGMIFFGLVVMSSSMKDIAALDGVRRFFATTSHPALLVLLGLTVTAIIQSSSATTGILISAGSAGLVGIEGAVFIIIGMNIGTCITAVLATIGTGINARRAAAIHLMFNLIGAIIFGILLAIPVIRKGAVWLLSSFGSFLPNGGIAAQIAAFHIIFNVTTTAALLPLADYLVKISVWLLPDKKAPSGKDFRLEYFSEINLETPSAAVSQLKKEILRMAEMAKINLDIAVKAVYENSVEHKEEFEQREKYLDWLNRQIPYYLTKISGRHLSPTDEIVIGSYYHVVSDIERIGDYAENLMENTEKLRATGLCFSEVANKEIADMYHKMLELYSHCIKGFENTDLSKIKIVDSLEDEIDDLRDSLSEAHIKRLNEGVCTAQTGAVYLSIISNLERISDHMRNIFYSMRKYLRNNPQVKKT